MALINCPECAKEISDTVKKCPSCGFIFKKKKSKKQVVILLLIVIILLVMIGFLGYKYVLSPALSYSEAMRSMDSGNYLTAMNEFQELGNYRDSADKANEARYNYGVSRINNKNYEDAVIVLTPLGNYKDTLAKIEEAELCMRREKMEKIVSSCLSEGTKLSSDGWSIEVDSEDEYDLLGVFDVEIIIDALDLPDSLYQKMLSTTALMGRQSETYEYYQVSWSYHPDNGLDVIFELVR